LEEKMKKIRNKKIERKVQRLYQKKINKCSESIYLLPLPKKKNQKFLTKKKCLETNPNTVQDQPKKI